MLSVIIPVYNEEDIIVDNTKKLMDFLSAKKINNYEIILSNNGSTDSTLEKAKAIEKQFPKKVKFVSDVRRGVGIAFRNAVKDSAYNKLVSVDMDLSIGLDFIPRAYKLLDSNSIIIGSKIASQKRPPHREVISKTYIMMAKVFLGLGFSDYSIGAKAYRKSDIIQHLSKTDNGSCYVVELMHSVKQDGKKIAEIEVSCNDTRPSKFNLLNEIFYRWKSLLTFWFREKITKRIIATPK